MIPRFNADGLLPEGVHGCAWDEFCRRFGRTRHRRTVLRRLRVVMLMLKAAGCREVLVDGSLVTRAPMPGDFDIAWNPAGVDRERSDPIVLEPDEHLAGIEAKYGGDVFVISAYNWVEIFSWVRDTPKRKGMLRLNPEEVQ